MTRIDARFDRLEARIEALATEMRAGFAELRTEIRTVNSELRRDMHQMALAIGVGYLGLAAAVIAAVT